MCCYTRLYPRRLPSRYRRAKPSTCRCSSVAPRLRSALNTYVNDMTCNEDFRKNVIQLDRTLKDYSLLSFGHKQLFGSFYTEVKCKSRMHLRYTCSQWRIIHWAHKALALGAQLPKMKLLIAAILGFIVYTIYARVYGAPEATAYFSAGDARLNYRFSILDKEANSS